MKKKKVKFTESFAGLGGADIKALDARYQKTIKLMEAQGTPKKAIDAYIANQKILNRYNAAPIGMPRDYSFKAGEEAMIPEELAAKWIEAGIYNAVEEKRKAA